VVYAADRQASRRCRIGNFPALLFDPTYVVDIDKRRAYARPDELVCMDSPLEGTGFEPSVPLLQKALLGVANRDVGTISGTT